jgi:hypothetical protein
LIETVAARPGTGADAVPSPPIGETYHPPFDRIILRIRNAIAGKFEQRRQWINAGIVQETEPFIIAITTGEMSDSVYPPDQMSFAERAVFPVDYGAWNVPVGAPVDGVKFSYGSRPEIQRTSGATVSTTVFMDPAFSAISALAFTPHHAVNYFQLIPEGRDVQLIHNPLASQPIPRGYFGFGTEVWVENMQIHRQVFYKTEN